ncbi:hypothetical protein [Listeria newyorkensis]|uniref:Uncharacterized protein n=1 Tax=Listeria newyorkensis TaxID=1497681 RepID=A0A841YYG2_9LIST|nr:hypothetical protein [Listeria newyorkensis]MBC1458460.1 hypothetical protein [Listeria newyorkensis]
MTENVVAFIFGIIFGGILATSIYSWIPYFKKEKSVINHIFDEYHEIETLKLNQRDYYDKFMRNKGYYVKSEDESSIIYQNSYGIDYMKVSKANFKEEPKMKKYHTETQEDYNALMVEFEKRRGDMGK